jgi:hypothetical protein
MDSRFRATEKLGEKEKLFEEFVDALRRVEKKKRSAKKEKVGFFFFLSILNFVFCSRAPPSLRCSSSKRVSRVACAAGGDQFGEHVNVRKYKKNVFFVAKNVENYPPINILVYVIIFLLQPNFFQDDEEIFGCAEPVEEVQAELCERNREDNKLSHETDPRFRVLLVDSVSRFMFFCGDKATFL